MLPTWSCRGSETQLKVDLKFKLLNLAYYCGIKINTFDTFEGIYAIISFQM